MPEQLDFFEPTSTEQLVLRILRVASVIQLQITGLPRAALGRLRGEVALLELAIEREILRTSMAHEWARHQAARCASSPAWPDGARYWIWNREPAA